MISQIKLLVMLTIIGGVQGFEGMYILTSGGPASARWCRGCGCTTTRSASSAWATRARSASMLFVIIFALTVLNLRYFRTAEQLQAT